MIRVAESSPSGAADEQPCGIWLEGKEKRSKMSEQADGVVFNHRLASHLLELVWEGGCVDNVDTHRRYSVVPGQKKQQQQRVLYGGDLKEYYRE